MGCSFLKNSKIYTQIWGLREPITEQELNQYHSDLVGALGDLEVLGFTFYLINSFGEIVLVIKKAPEIVMVVKKLTSIRDKTGRIERLRKWLHGEYMCVKCGKVWFSMGFGTGTMICPECYDGEKDWLFGVGPF